MYAVIFKAEFKYQDQEYSQTAERMRQLAINKYGCVEFVSVCEGENEISISYWESEDQIRRWKRDAEHIKAQEKGKSLWYKSYSIQVCKVMRSYSHNKKNEVTTTGI